MIRAIHFADIGEFRKSRVPGSVHFTNHVDHPNEQGTLLFFCPCGCGAQNRITVGEGFKPNIHAPSWHWDGNRVDPTLKPSVNVEGHWHGWLRGGYWEVC